MEITGFEPILNACKAYVLPTKLYPPVWQLVLLFIDPTFRIIFRYYLKMFKYFKEYFSHENKEIKALAFFLTFKILEVFTK